MNPISRATKARLCRTTRSWSIRLPSAAGATRARARDSPAMHNQMPTSMRPAMNRAITKWPRYAPPSAVPDDGRQRSSEEDRDGEERHAPGHERRALGRLVGELGGQRDVGHLEQGERGRGEDERQEHPHRGEARAQCRWDREDQDEGQGQQDPGQPQEGQAAADPCRRPVREPSHDRQDDDVPRLRDSHDEGRSAGGDPQRVGQVVGQDQPRHGGEDACADRAEGVGDDCPPGEVELVGPLCDGPAPPTLRLRQRTGRHDPDATATAGAKRRHTSDSPVDRRWGPAIGALSDRVPPAQAPSSSAARRPLARAPLMLGP